MTRRNDPKAEAEGEAPSIPLSRTQKKQEARSVLQLGLELIALSPSILDQLDLPSDLREAIDLCQRLKIRARSRQKRLIAQLLRAEDHAAIRKKLDKHGDIRIGNVVNEKENERWRKRLIQEGDPALQDFMEAHPTADRQQIRTFVRRARQETANKNTQRAQRELLRVIRSVRA